MRNRKFAPLVMPNLTAGRHRGPRQGACFMEFASYLAGERWSDHPECTHELLAQLARDVNDQLTDAARPSIASLIPRVVGLTSDNPRVATEIAVRAASAALPIASLERQRALAVGLLGLLEKSSSRELHALAQHALDWAPDAARWANAYVSRLGFVDHNNSRAEFAIVHTAVTAIALACVTDADERLCGLLVTAIEVVERHAHAPAPAPASGPAREKMLISA